MCIPQGYIDDKIRFQSGLFVTDINMYKMHYLSFYVI